MFFNVFQTKYRYHFLRPQLPAFSFGFMFSKKVNFPFITLTIFYIPNVPPTHPGVEMFNAGLALISVFW